MADGNRYPQIPSTVWWGLRSILGRTPSATVDERFLGVQLGVQEVAARAYIGELRSVGVLSEENKATPLALKWRLDENYAEAVNEIISLNYPEGLIQVAPPGEAEREKVVSWFLREGLGKGAAGNKAATYLLLSSPTPNQAPNRSPARTVREDTEAKDRPIAKRAAPVPANKSRDVQPSRTSRQSHMSSSNPRNLQPEAFPLNINVQIHISADAGTEQIESIFQAMKRYLYDIPNT